MHTKPKEKDTEFIIRKIPVFQLETGMVVAQAVTTVQGATLLPEKTTLTESMIHRLKLYRVQDIYVYQPKSLHGDLYSFNEVMLFDEIDNERIDEISLKHFKAQYINSAEKLDEYLKSFDKSQEVAEDDVLSCVNDIIDLNGSKSDLLLILQNLHLYGDFTLGHCLNVGLLCNLLGKWLDLPYNKLKYLTLSGILHDIGKLRVPEEVLNKPSRLTEEEFTIVKEHPLLGHEMVSSLLLPSGVKKAILHHHEKLDGSGYPYGLSGDDIPEFARIVAICDIFEAMISNRAYRDKMCPFTVIKMMEQDYITQLDPHFLLVFLRNIAQCYLGYDVLLSNRRKARIVFINQDRLSRPLVSIGNKIIDLRAQPEIFIEKIL